jgi:hypothetical protein
MANKSQKNKTALAVKSEPTVQDLVNMFSGSSALVQNDKEKERTLILNVAQAFEIPATCVNIMGGMPYINKDGLLFKLEEYESDEIVSLETKMVQYATKPGERAIAEGVLTLKNGRHFNAIGEADEMSVKLAAVKMTPNMMAETRAQNRVIRKAIAARMLRNLYTKLGGKNNSYNEEEKEVITNAIQSSAEEMTNKDAMDRVKQAADEATTKVGTIKPTPEQIIKMSLDKIQAADNPFVLQDYRLKIERSDLYSTTQKKMLFGAIDGKLKKYGKDEIV